MERRTVVFVLLSLAVWYTWLTLFPPPLPPEAVPANAPVPVVPAAPTPSEPAVRTQVAQRFEDLKGCGAEARWSNHGGSLSSLELPDRRAPYTVTPVWSWVMGGFGSWAPYGGDPGPAVVLSDRARAFAVGAGDLLGDPAQLTGAPGDARGRSQGLEITEKLTVVPGEPCTFRVDYTWRNTSSAPFKGPLWVSAHDAIPPVGGMFDRYTNHAMVVASVDGGVWTLSGFEELKAPEQVDDGAVDWLGIGDRYFAAFLAPETAHGTLVKSRLPGTEPLDGAHWIVREGLEPGGTHEEHMVLYVGVKDTEVLEAARPSLENSVELGWFAFFGHPLLWLLKRFHGIVGNWGLAIILLTVTVKAIFFPLTQSAFRSGQAMQAIQPKLQEIRETYQHDPTELNRRTVELFKEYRVNPLGGCLPMVLQIPVWIALYNVLLTSVELYQTEFLYLKDLSSIDPYCVLPVLVIAVMVVQQQFTPTANMDPMQAQMMKVMPLIFGIFFFTLPAGLVVYMFVNMVLSVLQQWFIKRTFVGPEAQVATG
ncbi:MAG: membrane protein insertase YidC [Alphaproteobacteria bacterium]|nr:membrane protein insertase YidC [Alphaproteobacteria bacterium]MCB9693248.1 membrane protein insertase YidC [Alphaproteobacteria bacterium]